jgi:signal transduction histidine kinase/streptogramin lyase
LTEYTTENGLSLNSVNDLYFDNQGFLWITTADGLQRFDGYRFRTFKHDALNKKSISENSITAVYEDMDGNLWVSHRSGFCFKPKRRYEFTELAPAIIGSIPVRLPFICIAESDSLVWVMVYPHGIYTVNKTSLYVKKTTSFPENYTETPFLQLSKVRSNTDQLWFRRSADKTSDLHLATGNGIRQFANKNKIKIHFLIPLANDSLVIIADNIVFKALKDDPLAPVKILNAKPGAGDFENEFITLPLKIANNQYLLPGDKKIWVYDANKEELNIFPHEQYFPGELNRYLNTSAADEHQNSWLGYNGIGGIKVISLRKFNLFNRPDKNALTYTLSSDAQGKIFAGIYLGDIEVYDMEGKFLEKLILPEAHKRFGSPRAMAMIDSVTLIVKSTLHELYAINTKNKTVQIISGLLPAKDSTSRVFEVGIQQISHGEVWLSYNNNIFAIRKDIKGFNSSSICTLPAPELITSFYKNNAGQLWIGTISGVWQYEKNDFTKISLPVTYVKHINQHPDGSIWLATTDGICVLRNKKLATQLNTNDGLPNSFIYSVLFDNRGSAWVSTNRGLAKITQAISGNNTVYDITGYSAREGLQGDEFNTKGYYKSSDGSLFFAGVNGINFFKPQELVSKSGPSETMLTEIEVNNLPYKPELQPEFINTITLSHRENNIRLSFSCMDFTVPGKNQYMFWLKGFQDNWSLPQNNNTVQYILPPGEYQLHVMSANYEGVWNGTPLVVYINILPPWYQTNWALTIFAFLILSTVGAVFYFISRSRYQKKLRKLQLEQEVQKEKQRLSRDLHDNLGSQLTWLSNNITQLQRAEQEHQPVEKRLDQLKEGAGELMQTLRETIWIINKEKISAVEFFDKLVSHAARHIEAYLPLQLQTEEHISVNQQINSGTALQLFRICQEAITNACKHAQATTITLKANADEKQFSITISDDGKGFDISSENLPGHYGLQNMQERANESKLQLKIESSTGKGASVTIGL